MGAGRDHHPVGTVLEHIVGGHLADADVNLDGLQLVELDLPVGVDAAPFGQTGILHDLANAPAGLGLGLAQMNIVAALAEDPRALHSGRPRADHQHGILARGLGKNFRMPAAPVLLV